MTTVVFMEVSPTKIWVRVDGKNLVNELVLESMVGLFGDGAGAKQNGFDEAP